MPAMQIVPTNPNAPALERYMIVCSGMGDTQIGLVSKEIWDWLYKPHCVPQEMLDIVAATEELREDYYGGKFEPSKLLENEDGIDGRAMDALAFCGDESWFSIQEAFESIQQSGIKIVDTYEGVFF